MEASAKPDIAAQIAAAFEWWREAGVDSDFADEPRDWLAMPPAEADTKPIVQQPSAPEVSKDTPRPRLGVAAAPPIDPATLPSDLTSFAAWWLTEPSLDAGIVSRRVPPRGSAQAEVMIVVAEPEELDAERLLSGAQGRLLGGIVAALELPDEKVYVASALPRHMPMPDWGELERTGLGQTLLHHVSLVQPRRVLMFGVNILSLLSHDPAQKPPFLPSINHAAPAIPLMVEPDLAALLARPRSKSGLWSRLLEWMGKRAE